MLIAVLLFVITYLQFNTKRGFCHEFRVETVSFNGKRSIRKHLLKGQGKGCAVSQDALRPICITIAVGFVASPFVQNKR